MVGNNRGGTSTIVFVFFGGVCHFAILWSRASCDLIWLGKP